MNNVEDLFSDIKYKQVVEYGLKVNTWQRQIHFQFSRWNYRFLLFLHKNCM